jgi:hypothetical protein
MVELTHRLRVEGQKVYPNAANLHEELADPFVQVATHLWKKNGPVANRLSLCKPLPKFGGCFDANFFARHRSQAGGLGG